MPIPPNATGSHDRVRLQRPFKNSITVHGTVVTFEPVTGNFSALMDFDPPGAAPLQFVRHDDKFVDAGGLDWLLVG